MDSAHAVGRVVSEHSRDITALVLGIVGTVLSALALGWNIVRDVRDVGRLRVRCCIGSALSAGTQQDNLLIWNVTNTGRRSVVVQTIGGDRSRDPKHFLMVRTLGNTLPWKLEPGEYAHYWVEDLSQLPPADEIEALYAIDTRGRYFHARPTEVREVRDELRRLRAGRGQGTREGS